MSTKSRSAGDRLWGLIAASVFLATVFVVSGGAAASADSNPVRTEPASNAVIARSPRQISLAFGAPIDTKSVRVMVYGSNHKPVASSGPRLAADNANDLVVDVPDLAKGVYTVVWNQKTVGDIGPRSGTFAFAVDPSGVSPSVVQQPKPQFVLPSLTRVIPKWLAFAMMMIFVGALALRFLVSARVARSLPDKEASLLLEATDRRLLLVAGGALLLFLPATLAQLVSDAGSASMLSFGHSFHPAMIEKFLSTQPSGHLWRVRLALTALTALVVLWAAASSLRRSSRTRCRRVGPIMVAGLVGGACELLVRTLPATKPADLPRAAFTSVLDWGHLLGASVWIGGLIGLVALAVFLGVPAHARGLFWPRALRRFSMVATVSVGVLTLTGLWTAWVHVGSPGLLTSTLYGRTLLVKLSLFLTLVGLGAFNQLWLLPRVETIRHAGDGRSTLGVLMGHFRRVLAVEAVLGVMVLLIVPFLSGSARNQSIQAKAANLTQTAAAGDLRVSLKPSGLQPGLTDYDVSVPKAKAGRVSVAFASTELGVPETEAVAVAEGSGHYRVSGLYTPMVGHWQVRVSVGQPDKVERSAVFELPVQSKPVSVKAPTPPVRATTWEYGIAEVIAVAAALWAVTRVSRRISSYLARGAATVSPQGAAS